MMQSWKFIVVGLIVMLVILSASGLALAQSSANFDLGCWGVFTTTGGESASPTFRLSAAVGQVAAGTVDSLNARLRIGYQQDWRTLQPVAPTPGPTVPPWGPDVYLPIISRYVHITRSCVR
jgi:hypothetical protein